MLCICILVSCLCVSALADTPECTIRGEKVVTSPDADVTMKVFIENNPGISGAQLIVSCDERLTLVSAENGDAFSALAYTPPGYFRNSTIFLWDSQEISDEDIKDGLLLTLTFHVAAEALGDIPVSISYESGNIFGAADAVDDEAAEVYPCDDPSAA